MHPDHSSGWGGWQFRVGARPKSDTLQWACKDAGGGPSFPCTTQPKGADVVVQGGWQEARGNCGVGAFFVENVKELLDAPREWFLDEV